MDIGRQYHKIWLKLSLESLDVLLASCCTYNTSMVAMFKLAILAACREHRFLMVYSGSVYIGVVTWLGKGCQIILVRVCVFSCRILGRDLPREDHPSRVRVGPSRASAWPGKARCSREKIQKISRNSSKSRERAVKKNDRSWFCTGGKHAWF